MTRALVVPSLLALALASAACTNNTSSPTVPGADGGGSCQIGVAAACTACVNTNCSGQASGAESACTAVSSCFCACAPGDTCCVEACGSAVTPSCTSAGQALAACVSASCAGACTLPTVTACGTDAGVDASPSDAGHDATLQDSGTPPTDSGAPDTAMAVDSGAADSGTADTGAPDTGGGGEDSGTVDAGPCLGTVLPSGHCEIVLATGQYTPFMITVDSTNVYFSGLAYGTVAKIPIGGFTDGGVPEVLGSNPTSGALAVVVNAENAFWTTELVPYQVDFAPLAGLPDAGANLLASSGGATGWGLAINANGVYWGSIGSGSLGAIEMTPLDGGPTSVIASNLLQPNGVALDDSYVYWTDETAGTVMRAPLAPDAGPATVIATGANNPVGIAVDKNRVYWTGYGGGGIFSAPLTGVPDGGPGTPLASTTGQPFGIATDGTNVYFTDETSVVSVPADGSGPQVTIADGFNNAWGIAVDDKNVYFTDRERLDGGVFQVSK